MKSIPLISNVILFLLFALPQQGVAQQPPEAQKMNLMVGEWKYEQNEGSLNCKWLGDFITHCESSWKNDAGETIETVWLNRYDQEAKVYTSHRFYSGGYTDSGVGWLDGGTWTFVFDGPAGARYRITSVISEDTWTFEWHSSIKGGSWEPGQVGSAKKGK